MTEHAATHNTELEQSDENNQQQNTCKNCHTPLSGPFCHQCGQPDKSIIRFFGTLIHELLEDIISLDSRAARTLFALLFRPGFLTKEYVSGRRFRYVPPLRLFLITSLFCIFVIWIINKTADDSARIIDDKPATEFAEQFDEEKEKEVLAELGIKSESDIEQLSEKEKQQVLKKLQQVNKAFELVGQRGIAIPDGLKDKQESQQEASEDVDKLIEAETAAKEVEQVLKEANQNIPPAIPAEPSKEELTNEVAVKTDNQALVEASPNEGIHISEGDINLNLSFLSEEDNQQLEERLKVNIEKVKEDPRDFIGDLLELIPKSMLLLVPIFAMLMKVCYPFARRYYIEHLIHAFHGHAFLFLSILIIIGLDYSSEGLEAMDNGFLQAIGSILAFIELLMFIWIPIYFFRSLQNVYQQHWVLTLWKFMLTGILYILLFAVAAVMLLLLSILYN